MSDINTKNQKNVLNDQDLEKFRQKHKLQPFRIKQIQKHIYDKHSIDFDEMTDLSKDLRAKLNDEMEIIPFSVKEIVDSGDTTKFVYESHDGKIFEAIAMYHYRSLKDDENESDYTVTKPGKRLTRITLCISSQIGCSCGCSFCVTGKLGFARNLSSQEILGQVLHVNDYIKNKLGAKKDGTLRKVRNVVFMGMGEPFLNYDNVKNSIQALLDQRKFSLSRHHITISTVGVVPGIQKMIQDGLDVKLAVSLHHPVDSERSKLIPVNSKYPLNDLMGVLDEYLEKFDHKVFYEYIMIKDFTDSLDLVNNLSSLIKNQNAHINLIPYNTNPAIPEYKQSSIEQIETFKQKLEAKDITVTIRQSMGRDQKGACGQLGYEQINKTK